MSLKTRAIRSMPCAAKLSAAHKSADPVSLRIQPLCSGRASRLAIQAGTPRGVVQIRAELDATFFAGYQRARGVVY
jgi:hypothetical protein